MGLVLWIPFFWNLRSDSFCFFNPFIKSQAVFIFFVVHYFSIFYERINGWSTNGWNAWLATDIYLMYEVCRNLNERVKILIYC